MELSKKARSKINFYRTSNYQMKEREGGCKQPNIKQVHGSEMVMKKNLKTMILNRMRDNRKVKYKLQ